jgi:hypothetical protein
MVYSLTGNTMRVLELYYTVTEVSLLLRMSEDWVRGQVHSGALTGAVSFGSTSWRVPASSVNALLDRHQVAPAQPLIARTEGELRRKVRARESNGRIVSVSVNNQPRGNR